MPVDPKFKKFEISDCVWPRRVQVDIRGVINCNIFLKAIITFSNIAQTYNNSKISPFIFFNDKKKIANNLSNICQYLFHINEIILGYRRNLSHKN